MYKLKKKKKMTNFLIKIFIKDKDNVEDQEVRGKYAMLSSITGIIVNILLSIFKIIIGVIANSMSIISDGINNVSDAGSSIVTMIGFKMSQKKIDADHPWGHGRMEYITALFVDVLILLVGFELLQSSIDKIIHPEMPSISNITIILLVVAILVKLWLFLFYRKIAKKINSAAIKGTAYDSISDSISTLAVLVSALVARFASISIDGYVSLLVSIFILITGIKAIKEIIDLLLGQKPDAEFVHKIEEFTKNYDAIVGIHDIMVHDYGPGRRFLTLHAEVNCNDDIMAVHDAMDIIERAILDKYHILTTIHMDPIDSNDALTNELKEMVATIVKDINQEYSIHDFRVVTGPTHTNLIFDVLLPIDDQVDHKSLKKEIDQKIKNINENYFTVMQIEHSYI